MKTSSDTIGDESLESPASSAPKDILGLTADMASYVDLLVQSEPRRVYHTLNFNGQDWLVQIIPSNPQTWFCVNKKTYAGVLLILNREGQYIERALGNSYGMNVSPTMAPGIFLLTQDASSTGGYRFFLYNAQADAIYSPNGQCWETLPGDNDKRSGAWEFAYWSDRVNLLATSQVTLIS